MNNRTLRFIIIISVIILGGLIRLQVYWVKKAYEFTEEQFDNRVILALMTVANQVNRFNKDTMSVREPVTQVAPDYFTVEITGIVNPDHLQNLLVIEFNRYNIDLEFQYALYDCFLDSIVWSKYLERDIHGKRLNKSEKQATSFPSYKLSKESHKFGVYFPTKNRYISKQMGIMIYSTIGVFIIVLFFVYILMIIFKQKRLSEIKTDFINNMTHEFKTPIATISISSEQLMKENTLNNPEKIKTYSQIIKDESNRLKSQVDQILNIALLDSTRTQLSKKPIDFHAIITDVTEKVKIRAEEKKCRIKLELEALQHIILGDADHVTNVMFNLMDNALKYSKENPQIIIRTKNKNQFLIVEVEDNGIGIPAKQQKMIFEKFYRVPTGNVHNVKGFGLGLSYVKKIVQLHQGKVELESTPGIGTIFRIIVKYKPQKL